MGAQFCALSYVFKAGDHKETIFESISFTASHTVCAKKHVSACFEGMFVEGVKNICISERGLN